MSEKDSYTPIQCQLYDYVEIACMRHYRLDIELITGEIITGMALTTLIKNKQEFIVINLEMDSEENHPEIENANQDKKQEIRLDLVKSITTLDSNAEFAMIAIN